MRLERVFIDANVLVSALPFDGNERKVLRLAADRKICPIFSELVLREAHRVVEAKFPTLAPKMRTELSLLDYELVTDIKPSLITQAAALVRDPADVEVLAAILASKPDVALTGDKDLLTDEVKAVAPTCRCAEYLDRREEAED